MKKIITLLALAVALTATTSCTDKKDSSTKEKKTDIEQTRTEIVSVTEKFHAAYKAKDVQSIKALLLDTGVYADTDPNEIMSRDPFVQHLMQKLQNPAVGTIDYKIDQQEIVFDDAITGAMVIEKYKMNIFSQFIPWRMVSHLIWKNGAWKYDFISISLTPPNDVLPAVNAAAYKQ